MKLKKFDEFTLNESTEPDVYNIAFEYLYKKYPSNYKELVGSVRDKLKKARNKKERKEIQDSITDKDYIKSLTYSGDDIKNHDDKELYLLLKQYSLGSDTIKKELLQKLKAMKIIK